MRLGLAICFVLFCISCRTAAQVSVSDHMYMRTGLRVYDGRSNPEKEGVTLSVPQPTCFGVQADAGELVFYELTPEKPHAALPYSGEWPVTIYYLDVEGDIAYEKRTASEWSKSKIPPMSDIRSCDWLMGLLVKQSAQMWQELIQKQQSLPRFHPSAVRSR